VETARSKKALMMSGPTVRQLIDESFPELDLDTGEKRLKHQE
jgi:hypothetical protein